MHVYIQKIDPQALMPTYAHPGDAGMDIYSNADMVVQPQERTAVPTGIAMAVPEGYVALVWDKSGRALNEGLTTLAGVIDSGYRGEVRIVVLNIGTEPIQIVRGQKLAQILIQPVVSAELSEVDNLNETTRGAQGFGSTGI